MNGIQSPRRVLLVALILGWSVDLLFYSKPLGISILIFVIGVIVALFSLSRLEGVRSVGRNLWLPGLLVFFAGMVFVRANPFLTFLNVVAVLVLLGYIAHFYAAGQVDRLGLIGHAMIPILVGVNALFRAAPLVSASVDLEGMRQQSGRNLLPVARGLFLALPVLILFSVLLASADVIFADYLRRFFSLDILARFMELVQHFVVIMIAAWVLAGGLAYTFSRASGEGAAPGSLPRMMSLGFIEAATVLITVDLLFLVFVWIQFAYLFGGQANIRVDGFTYAEYARRGFFELVSVSVLTLGLILGLDWLARRKTDWQVRIFNSLSSLMVGLVLVMLASAFQRMRLYEMTYGFTELRLYVYVFIVWLGVTLLWFLVTLWRGVNRFAIGAFAAGFGFLITLNILNPDAFITEQNLIRYRSTGKLDACYLTTLSDDAVPELVQAIDQVNGQDQERLVKHLRARWEEMEQDAGWRNWPSFHVARWRAYNLLTESLMQRSIPGSD